MKKIGMKKWRILLCGILMAFAFSGCQSGETASEDGGLKVVSTIFPGYDWAGELMSGTGNTPELMMKNGVDMHSFQPSAADIVSLSDADVFIYVGGESDVWVEGALKTAQNEQMVTVNMMELLGDSLMHEELAEGMESDHDHDEEEGHDEVYDEHVWLSIENAEKVCTAIADALSAADEENAARYQDNLSAYLAKLTDLDHRYQQAADNAEHDVLLFGDRFPFVYLTDEYDLEYYAAFPGCSAESEASFSTISFLAGKADEMSLPVVLTIDGSDQKIAKTIIENTTAKNAEILTLDSMQSVTDEQIEQGVSYLSIMENNLSVLEKALS